MPLTKKAGTIRFVLNDANWSISVSGWAVTMWSRNLYLIWMSLVKSRVRIEHLLVMPARSFGTELPAKYIV